MSKLGKGWSSTRGRATHYYDAEEWSADRQGHALCGAPIRILWWGSTKKLQRLSVCDRCQAVRRKRARR